MNSQDLRKVVAYGRVSSTEQAENQHAAEQQCDRLKTEKVDELFFDIESGNSDKRPEFVRLIEQVKTNEIGVVIATRWDRLTRNEAIYLNLKILLQRYNVRLILLDQGEVDLTSASGELSADMQVIFAVHERRMLRERILRGHEYRRKRQVAWTRAPFGYIIRDDRYVLDTRPIVCLLRDRPEQYLDLYSEPDNSPKLFSKSRSEIAAETIQIFQTIHRPRKALSQLYERYGVECKAFVEIKERNQQPNNNSTQEFKRKQKRTNLVLTEELLLWSSGGSLSDWIQNPVLRGHTAYRKYHPQGGQKPPEEWEIHYNTHPDQTLLSEEGFQEIQLILKQNRRKVGQPGSKCQLTGLIVCNRCGYKMGLKRSPEYQYYGCSTIGCANRKCVRVEKIEEAIATYLFQYALASMSDSSKQTLEEQEPVALQALQNQLRTIDAALEHGSNEVLKRVHHELLQQIKQFEQDRELLDIERATAQEILAHPVARDLSFWHTRTYEERELLYDKLLKKVSINEEGEIVAIKLTV